MKLLLVMVKCISIEGNARCGRDDLRDERRMAEFCDERSSNLDAMISTRSVLIRACNSRLVRARDTAHRIIESIALNAGRAWC
jgi:hypothetical protein